MLVRAIIGGGLLFLSFTAPAYAYIDPGAGSFIIQMLAAVFFGALFYLRRVRDFLLRLVSPRRWGKGDREERK